MKVVYKVTDAGSWSFLGSNFPVMNESRIIIFYVQLNKYDSLISYNYHCIHGTNSFKLLLKLLIQTGLLSMMQFTKYLYSPQRCIVMF